MGKVPHARVLRSGGGVRTDCEDGWGQSAIIYAVRSLKLSPHTRGAHGTDTAELLMVGALL